MKVTSPDYNLNNLKKITVKNRGIKMYITPRYCFHYVENEYERFTADIVQQYTKPSSTFVDVGAHYGFYSLLVAKKIPQSKVVAIEPVAENFQILKKNVRLNKIKNISVYNLAASNRMGIRKLKITEASDSCGFYKHPLSDTILLRKTKTISLDQLLKNKKIDIIKIDVEGHEIDVLKGAKNILKNKDIRLIIEFSPKTLKNARVSPLKLLTKLQNFNFEIFLIKDNPKHLFRITDDLNSWKQLIGNLDYVNLFCLKKKEVLSVVFFSHSSGLGGAERSLLELIKGLLKRNVIATVILPSHGPLVTELEKLKVPFLINPYSWWCELNKKNNRYKIEKNAWNLEKLQEIFKFLKLAKPHLVYTNTITIPWGALISKTLGIPHIWHIHEFGEQDHNLIFDTNFKNIGEFINKHSQMIIANSKAVAKNLEKHIPKNKIGVSYYSIELKTPTKVSRKKIFNKKTSLKLIFVGALAPGKNQKEAILAVNELKKKGVQCKLVLLGPCYHLNYRKELKKLIDNHQLNDYVKIIGPASNVIPYLKQADIALICSKKEAFGRVIVEAMLCKKPVIGSRSGGTAELIKDGYNGFLYQPGNYRQLAQRIDYLYKNPQKILKLGENGYKYAQKNFSEEKYSGRIYQILKKIRNKKPKTNEFESLLIKSFASLLELKNLQKNQILWWQNKIKTLGSELIAEKIKTNKYLSDLNRIYRSKTWKILRVYQFCQKKVLDLTKLLFPQNLFLKLKNNFISFLKPIDLKKAYTFDLWYFPIIDWHFRFQRSQQICSQLAKNGHRIFYLKPSSLVVANKNLTKGQIATIVKIKKINPNIFEVALVTSKHLNIYQDIIPPLDKKYLSWSLETVCQKMQIRNNLAVLALPFWYPLIENQNWQVIYDCMDEHSGFSNISKNVLEQEKKLIEQADLVIFSSQKLLNKNKKLNPNFLLVKNAADFYHFVRKPSGMPTDLKSIKHPLIGYYGAIADWFDEKLVEYLSLKRPHWQFVFIGHIMKAKIDKLKILPNIHFLEEKPYKDLPSYLYQFDCFIIPFQLTKLILATNPVKAYEVLSSGKPIVSVNLPELQSMENLVYLAKDKKDFLVKIERALKEKPSLINQRIEFGKKNTWDHRTENIIKGIKKYVYPKVSLVVVSYNTLPYLKKCLKSIYQYSHYPNLEIIVVDNNSKDKTVDYLKNPSKKDNNLKIILSKKNFGFAGGNNLGIKKATGQYIILLNNDTVVIKNWIVKLIKHLDDPKVGLVGPVTNWIGNEAKIDLGYKNLKQMHKLAKKYIEEHKGKSFEIPMLAFFCVAARKSLFDKIGMLDEQFTTGFFEDDDYCRRVKLAGFKTLCAEDVFIHHFGNQSFKQILPEKKKKIFEENKKKFEEKWGFKWQSHKYRKNL